MATARTHVPTLPPLPENTTLEDSQPAARIGNDDDLQISVTAKALADLTEQEMFHARLDSRIIDAEAITFVQFMMMSRAQREHL